MRGLLGIGGYYRCFIKDFGKIVAPLTNLLKTNAFKWSSESESAFDRLKQALTQAPILTLPHFTKAFIVESDASGAGPEAILMQDNKPIAYFSKVLRGRHAFIDI